MRFEKYYITDKNGNSNCLIRSLCRIYNKEYEEVFGDLCSLAKDLKLEDGNYIVFAFDKKDWYHIVNIENNVLYDRANDSLELYVISIYKLEK